MYAVVRTGGKQVRVAPGEAIRIEKLDGSVGDSIELGNHLCSRGELERASGRPDAARACLEEAASLAAEAGVGPESDLGRAVGKLREALGEA